MIEFVTGNIFDSDTEALVNTVNCDGYMGKGLAYQFKLKYPKNNEDYIRACKSGNLKIGKVHYYKEMDKVIINFPTKDKWREKSKIEYIESGLDDFIILIDSLNIMSVAIPPLGSGNGGLNWIEVKSLIEDKLYNLSKSKDILIYEPSKNYSIQPLIEPKLSLSALILMQIKMNLLEFNNFRLQKTAYIMDILLDKKYFKFKKYKYGPYDHSIDIISKNISEFQKFHNVQTDKAYIISINTQISKKTVNTLDIMMPALKKSTEFVNRIKSDTVLECISTILFIIDNNNITSEEQIVSKFKEWSKRKETIFKRADIIKGVNYLIDESLIYKDLLQFKINKNYE